MSATARIAALFVETGGCYFGLPHVDPWDKTRDARLYDGPHPVIAHPPCERWGRYWGGSPTTWPRLTLGDDAGCFASALASVRKWGGVLEHPEGSHAWRAYGLNVPPRHGGWINADFIGGWTCCVEQGHYGHLSRKATWLYAMGTELPTLIWGPSEQRIHPAALAKHGYAKARRIGVMAMVGGKNKTRIRNATPIPFRDLLLAIAGGARLGPVESRPVISICGGAEPLTRTVTTDQLPQNNPGVATGSLRGADGRTRGRLTCRCSDRPADTNFISDCGGVEGHATLNGCEDARQRQCRSVSVSGYSELTASPKADDSGSRYQARPADQFNPRLDAVAAAPAGLGIAEVTPVHR